MVLDDGPIEELRAKCGDNKEAESSADSEKLGPSIVIKSNKDTHGPSV